jgi:hypothetical protein
VAVSHSDDFKGHGCSTVNCILYTAGGTETAVAAKRDEFHFSAFSTGIHGTAKSGITTIDHFIYIFAFTVTKAKSKNNLFIIVQKNLLKFIHKTIMRLSYGKENPTPS